MRAKIDNTTAELKTLLNQYTKDLDSSLSAFINSAFESSRDPSKAISALSEHLNPILPESAKSLSKFLMKSSTRIEIRRCLYLDVSFMYVPNKGTRISDYILKSDLSTPQDIVSSGDSIIVENRYLEEQGNLIGFENISPDSVVNVIVIQYLEIDNSQVFKSVDILAYG